MLHRVEDLDPALAADILVAWVAAMEGPEKDEAPPGGKEHEGRETSSRRTRYRVLSDPAGNPVPLGRGGFAQVVRAWDERLEREVALKVPFANAAKADGDTILHEGARLASLSHPGLLPVHDLTMSDSDQPALVLPIAPGGTLAEKLAARRGAVCPDAAFADLLRAFRRVVETVDYLHGLGVFHGDIKGANVLLGDHGEVYLHDLGAAVTGTDDLEAGFTVGTSAWMPGPTHPARRRGPDRDVWQLGGLLATICTGATSPAGTDLCLDPAIGLPAATSYIVWPRPLSALRSVARQCMDARQRVRAKDILGALDAWDAGRVVVGHEYSPLEWLRLKVRQHRIVVAGAAVAVVAIAVMGVAGWFRDREADAARVERLALAASAGAPATPPDPSEARVLAVERLQYGESSVSRGVLIATATTPTPTLAWSVPHARCDWLTSLPVRGRLACLSEDGMRIFDQEGRSAGAWPMPGGRSRPVWSVDEEHVVVVGSGELERWTERGLQASAGLRDEEVTASGLAPGGAVAVGYRDGVIEIRDPQDLSIQGTFSVAPGTINALASVGSEVVAGSVGDWLRAVDLATGVVRDVLAQGLGARFLLVAGGELIVAGRRAGGDPDLVRINPLSGVQLAGWDTGAADLRHVASGGHRLATAATGGPITVWSSSGNELARISLFEQAIASIAMAPAGDYVAAGSSSGGLFVWALPSDLDRLPATHAGPVSGIAARGSTAVSTGEDATLRIWGLPGMSPRCTTPIEAGYASGLQLLSDGRTVLGDSEGGVYVATPDCMLHRIAKLGTARIRRPALSPDESLLAVGDNNRGVHVFDTRSWRLVLSAHFEQNPAGIVFSADGTRLYATSFGDELLTVTLATLATAYGRVPGGGSEGRVFTGLIQVGSDLIAGGRDGDLLRWPIGDVEKIEAISIGSGRVTALEYSPASGRIAAGLSDGTIVLTGDDGKCVAEWPAHRGATWGLAFAEEGSSLVSGGADGKVVNWKLTGFDMDVSALARSVPADLGLKVKRGKVTLVGK